MIIRLFFLIVLFFLGTACENLSHDQNERILAPVIFSARVMTIDYKVLVGHHLLAEEKKSIERLIKDTFSEIDAIYNKWNFHSELSKLNRLKAGVICRISPQLEKILHLSQKVFECSSGRFDPTIEPLQSLWKIYLEKGLIPPQEQREALRLAVGFDKIHFGNGFFIKDHDLTSLDLGGIAKGLAVDLLVERLNHAGYPNIFVEWGGEIRATGQHPDQRPWNIFISRLGKNESELAIATLSLVDQAIATSGDYLQNWSISTGHGLNKKTITYCHIIDPRTLQPLTIDRQNVASASVLASTCALADALATAAMLFPNIDAASKWAKEMQEQMPSLEFWLVSRESLSNSN